MNIEELIKTSEGKQLEFKQDLSSVKPLLKTLVAFANTAGGRLIIGVDDAGSVVGVEHPLDEEERICSLIADSITPRLVPNIELLTVDGKTILVVEVFLSGLRPHFLKSIGAENGVFVRLGSTNRQADTALIQELQRSVDGVVFDEMLMPDLLVEDLDLSSLQPIVGNPADEHQLETLKLLGSHQGRKVPSKGAILLFGKERLVHFPDAWIQCGRFFGTEKIDIFDHIEINHPLPTAVDEVMLFLKKHAIRGADLSEIRRKDVWSIPLSILREVIINALVHADYSQRGAPMRVAFLDDRIEVENAGILLPGLTIEEMKQGTSKIRNAVIARVFRELKLIEQWGTGVRRIFSEAQRQGLPEPKIEEIGMRLRFTIYLAKPLEMKLDRGLESEKGAESGVATPPVAPPVAPPVSRYVMRLLQLLEQSGMLGFSEILQQLGLSDRRSLRKTYITPALTEKLIAYTLPEKPNSRLQQYRITAKGEAVLAQNKK